MLLLQLVGLTGDVVPLPTADAVDVGRYLEPVLEESPVLLLRAAVARIGDGVAKVGHPLALPGVGYHCLRQSLDGKGQKESQRQ